MKSVQKTTTTVRIEVLEPFMANAAKLLGSLNGRSVTAEDKQAAQKLIDSLKNDPQYQGTQRFRFCDQKFDFKRKSHTMLIEALVKTDKAVTDLQKAFGLGIYNPKVKTAAGATAAVAATGVVGYYFSLASKAVTVIPAYLPSYNTTLAFVANTTATFAKSPVVTAVTGVSTATVATGAALIGAAGVICCAAKMALNHCQKPKQA